MVSGLWPWSLLETRPCRRSKGQRPKSEDRSYLFDSPIIAYYSLIGFDRSAFVARPRGCGSVIKN